MEGDFFFLNKILKFFSLEKSKQNISTFSEYLYSFIMQTIGQNQIEFGKHFGVEEPVFV